MSQQPNDNWGAGNANDTGAWGAKEQSSNEFRKTPSDNQQNFAQPTFKSRMPEFTNSKKGVPTFYNSSKNVGDERETNPQSTQGNKPSTN